jgi:cytoskeletal protein RodZ
MQDSTDAAARRPIILYIIIAIALFVALILGVRWAKSRAAYYSQPQTGQNQQVTQESQPQGNPEEEPAPAAPQSPSTSNSNESHPTASTPTANTPVASTGGASRVPSTGPEQILLPIVSLSAVVFAALSYVRARRRLETSALEA